MEKKLKNPLIITVILFLLFVVFTVIIKTVDVQPIGPQQSTVGLATVNQFMFKLFGVNMLWYHLTDLLGIVAMAIAFGFAVLGMFQLIKGRSIKNVDGRILLLGGFYVVVGAIYVFFERVIINYRPIILSQNLEASYPSSHVMLVVCLMVTAMFQFHHYWGNKKLLLWLIDVVSILVIVATVIGRLLAGIHWFTDILASILLSAALVSLYWAALKYTEKPSSKKLEGKELNPC